MRFEVEGNIHDALIESGYKYYGESTRIFKKHLGVEPNFSPDYFHASIDYNYPVVELHIDRPRKQKAKGKLSHTTDHTSGKIRLEINEIRLKTFEGQLNKLRDDLISQFIQSL